MGLGCQSFLKLQSFIAKVAFLKPRERYAELIQEIAHLSPDKYYDFVFHFDEEHYNTRVDMVDFKGASKVLDAGCGYGQWAVSLAQVNEYVIGIDLNPNMIEISNIVSKKYGCTNVEFRVGSLPHLDFPDEEFDLIWCWGVIMFINRADTLREFNRLLKPGGRFFIGCANSIGRWLYKATTALAPWSFNPTLLQVSLRTLRRGHALEAVPNYTTLRQCHELCTRFGFTLVAASRDGYIDVTGQQRKRPMFPPKFLAFDNNIEFLGRKI